MTYLKINGKRYNLTFDEMICDGAKLCLYIPSSEITIPEIRSVFSNLDEIIVYSCILNEDLERDENGNATGEKIFIETDEYIATRFEGFTRIIAINYNLEYDFYEIIFVSPIDIDTRMSDMEEAMNFLLMGGDM